MTVKTDALIPQAPKSGKAAEVATDGRGGGAAKDAAAAFQSILQGMKREGTQAGSGEEDSHGASTGNRSGGQAGAGAGTGELDGKTAQDGAKTSGQVTFSTSNLVDALRQVSHNVMSGISGDGSSSGEGEDAGPAGDRRQAGAELAAATIGLPPGAVPARKPGQSPHAAAAARTPPGSGTPGGAPDPAPQALAGRDGAARTGTSSLFAQFGVEPETASGSMTSSARGSTLPEEATGAVKVLRQETHFAPNLRLSPAQQVADQVGSALKSLASDTRLAAQGGVTHKAEGPVLKTLDIQLTPHELGTVKVSLRMVGDTVEVTLQTSKAQTADLLRQDRQLLDQMLRTTGFKADAITIQAADDRASISAGSGANGNSAMNQNTSGNGTFSDGQPQNSGNGNFGQNPDRRGQEAHGNMFPETDISRGKDHEEDTGNSLSDGIYL